MKLLFLLFLASVISNYCIAQGLVSKPGSNPLLMEFDAPFGCPPFEKIKLKHYLPAFKEGMKQHQAEIAAIVKNQEIPTFENTIVALDRSGELLGRTQNIFYNMNGALTSDAMQKIAMKISPLISKHYDDINLNEQLFKRVEVVYQKKSKLKLSTEQAMLLEKTYKSFVKNGANLEPRSKKNLRKINKQLSMLALKFNSNVLKETNTFYMMIDKKEDLAGLPQMIIDSAAETAEKNDLKGKWLFTLDKPSWIPFLQYSEKRKLREKLYRGYINQGDNNNELDNKKIFLKMIKLRLEKAKLLGYKSHAHFVLDSNMAKNPENVYQLLEQMWKPALKVSKEEAKQFQEMIDQEGKKFKLESWDWWYYAEKVRKTKYDLDENELRPYFKLENVRDGAFAVANKLYGLKFIERTDLPKYHPDVKTFEVQEADGSLVGIFYTDYFPRSSKRGGAWMSAFRQQSRKNGKKIHPIIVNCGNFTKPTGDKPALLTLDEAKTLFHEFGHALHGLLSDCTYTSLSGTSVYRDFVELPSQVMENWACEPEVLKMYAKHYKTGEPIPQQLIDKLTKSSHFNQGFMTVEYLAASYLDMDWHTLTDTSKINVLDFEKKSMERIGLISEIIPRYRTTYFRHVVGGYSAGYYSYIWAEVLDADAFQAFQQTSLFDKKTAKLFRENILERGGTEPPMDLYIKFRGKKPDSKPLLKRRGLDQ